MRALLLIDIQSGLTKRKLYNKELFLRTINQAIDKFRKEGLIVIFVQHTNKQLLKGTEEWQIDNSINIKDDDYRFEKKEASAFSSCEFVSFIKEHGISELVVGGLVSHGCVTYTCKSGLESGLYISLLENGHTSWGNDAEAKVEKAQTALVELGVHIIKADYS